MGMEKSLSLEDLFNPQASAAAYRRLIDVINFQSKHILSLDSKLNEMEKMMNTQQKLCVSLQSQLDKMHEQTEILQAEKQANLSLIEKISKRLIKAEKKIESGAKEEEVNKKFQEMERYNRAMFQEIRTQAADFQLISSLQVDQARIHEKLKVVNHLIESKVDKAEASHLEAVVAKIHAFGPTTSQLWEHIHELEQVQQDQSDALVNNTVKWKENHVQMDQMKQKIQATASRKALDSILQKELGTEMKERDKKIQQMNQAIKQLLSETAILKTKQQEINTNLDTSISKWTKTFQSQTIDFQNMLDDKVSTEDCERVWSEIRHELHCKVWKKELDQHHTEQQKLDDQVQLLERKVGLSTRFLEWFADRGEAYEHNFELLEAQVSRLAIASNPNNRSPYSNQVRFT